MAVFDQHVNYGYGLVSVAPSPASSGTTFSTSNADAGNFPDPSGSTPYNVEFWPTNSQPTKANAEIVRITAKGAADSGGAGNTQFTITRTQEGTSARSVLVGDQVALAVTKKMITDLEAGIPQVKGSIGTFDTGATTLPVGTDNQVLIADSTQTKGIKWGSASAISLVWDETPTGTINGSNTVFTTANTFSANSLVVKRDGLTLTHTTDYTENGGLNGFTMITAPATGSTLRVSYTTSAGTFATGSANWTIGELITSNASGSTTAYTVANNAYIAGTTAVYINGVRKLVGSGNDYTETTPASGIFTFTTAPVAGSVIEIDYQKTVSTAGNASFVNGLPASDTIVSGDLVTDYYGWQKPPGTFTYASATTITTSNDLTPFVSIGDKIKWNDGSLKYGYITAITSSLITLTGGSDYSVANAVISGVFISKASSPFGFPQWFNYTSTQGGFSVNQTQISRFSIVGRVCTVMIIRSVNGTSNATTFTQTLPVTPANITNMLWWGYGPAMDNTLVQTIPAASKVSANSTTLTVYKDFTAGSNAWTASGNKGADTVVSFEI